MLGELVVCYLFLGGAGAGACLVLSGMGVLVPRDCISRDAKRIASMPREYRKLFGSAYALALAALALGMLCLFVDLGRADRVFLLLTSPKATHITVGAYALALCFIAGALQMLIWTRAIRRCRVSTLRLLCALTAILSLVVMLYTGLLLQSLQSVPLWDNAWLPALFALSALSCGAALVMGSSLFAGLDRVFGSVLRRVAALDGIAIAAEALAAAVFLLTTLSSPSETAVSSGEELVRGASLGIFWVGFVLLGLAIPFALDCRFAHGRRSAPSLGAASAACVLVGGFALRYCLVQAGAYPGI